MLILYINMQSAYSDWIVQQSWLVECSCYTMMNIIKGFYIYFSLLTILILYRYQLNFIDILSSVLRTPMIFYLSHSYPSSSSFCILFFNLWSPLLAVFLESFIDVYLELLFPRAGILRTVTLTKTSSPTLALALL